MTAEKNKSKVKVLKKLSILVVGSGGREHALVWKIAQSPLVEKIYCAPGNVGTAELAENIPIKANDIQGLLAFVQSEKISLTIVGPEEPLSKGIVGIFNIHGLSIFGPTKEAAMLESSKLFAKELMVCAGVRTAPFTSFRKIQEAKRYLGNNIKWPKVIKADGLAAGKGVFICDDVTVAERAVNEILFEKKFGSAGDLVLIEEFLSGEEASYLIITDGENFVPLASAQDHKRLLDNDKGSNTGGMGAYSPAPVLTPALELRVQKEIVKPILEAMSRYNRPFKGVLYVGLMIKNSIPYVLEFNVRFGDPEIQPIIMRMKSDIVPWLMGSAQGDLYRYTEERQIVWDSAPAVCVVMASKGYPETPQVGKVIIGLKTFKEHFGDSSVIFHAGTKRREDNRIITSGGRVLGVTAKGDNIIQAVENAYQGVKKVSFSGMYYRTDIAARAINRK
jgi:phosphoribosylamine---glycine ligase